MSAEPLNFRIVVDNMNAIPDAMNEARASIAEASEEIEYEMGAARHAIRGV
jgi:hypothetical protein